MDEDQLHYAIPTLSMPPENRISCALEGMVVLRQTLGLAMAMLGTRQLKFTADQMKRAPAVYVSRDKAGNVTAELQS